jgi:hypothetical protein
MSMIPYFCRFRIQILEMLKKSFPHIIFNKWTFIDLMLNLMAICATWRIWSWNFIHIVNPFIPIHWNSSNYVSILLIKYGSTILHFYYRNPNLGLATKAKGVARLWAKRKPGNHITYSRECRKV